MIAHSALPPEWAEDPSKQEYRLMVATRDLYAPYKTESYIPPDLVFDEMTQDELIDLGRDADQQHRPSAAAGHLNSSMAPATSTTMRRGTTTWRNWSALASTATSNCGATPSTTEATSTNN